MQYSKCGLTSDLYSRSNTYTEFYMILTDGSNGQTKCSIGFTIGLLTLSRWLQIAWYDDTQVLFFTGSVKVQFSVDGL